jgi:hypothetical protein
VRLTRSIRVPSAASWITWNSGHRVPTRAIVVRRRDPRRAPRRVLDGPIPSLGTTKRRHEPAQCRHHVVTILNLPVPPPCRRVTPRRVVSPPPTSCVPCASPWDDVCASRAPRARPRASRTTDRRAPCPRVHSGRFPRARREAAALLYFITICLTFNHLTRRLPRAPLACPTAPRSIVSFNVSATRSRTAREGGRLVS